MNNLNENANKLEAILIATSEPLSKKEISEKIGLNVKELDRALKLLSKRYEQTALQVKNYGKRYKIVVREQYSQLSYMFSELELTQGEMEILALVYKSKKIYLSQVRRLRGPKSIEEISHLEKLGYIKLQRIGRYNVIKLTRNFVKKFGDEIEKELKPPKSTQDLKNTQTVSEIGNQNEEDRGENN